MSLPCLLFGSLWFRREHADTLPGYNCTPEENEVALGALRARTWLALRRKLAEQTSDATVLATLRDTFEERFRYDETGVPRVWKPEDDLESAFKKAKEEVGGYGEGDGVGDAGKQLRARIMC